jgi:8-oxo-dGTP pyrophosphatase MutT (NUDIX family)
MYIFKPLFLRPTNFIKPYVFLEGMEESNQNLRQGVTAVIYDDMGKPYFLILKRKLNWEGWEFAKGGVEEGESELDALKREVIEETGLQKFKIVKKIENVDKKYQGKDGILNIHSVYLIEASMNIPIHLPTGEGAEHSTYLWTDYDSTISKLTWDNDKAILDKVMSEIK